jgi:predicted dehydrogenase
MKLRVGVIGLGDAWESRHRGALLALSDRFEVRAVCAEVVGLARQVAGEFGADLVGGFRALACREDLEAVLVLSPDWYGPLPILAACDAGKAVYCASPLDLDLERSDEVKKRVEESGIAFMVEFPRRHAPATVRLRELMATRLGPPWLLQCHGRDSQSGPDELRSTGSRYRPPSEDPGWQSMVEMIDWCCYIADRPVIAVTASDHATGASDRHWRRIQLEFDADQGLVADLHDGRTVPRGWEEAENFRAPAELQVSCQHGVAFIDLPATLVWFDEAGRHVEKLEQDRPVGQQMLTLFHRCVTSLVRNIDSLEDSCRALRLMQAAEQSLQDGEKKMVGEDPMKSS